MKDDVDSEGRSPHGSEREQGGPSAAMKAMRSLGGTGTEILASIIGLGLLGYGFDLWCGSDPWFMVIGLVLGTIGGIYNAVKKGRAYFEGRESENARDR